MGGQKSADEIYCRSCGEVIKKEAEICPNCGVRNENSTSQKNTYKSPIPSESNKVLKYGTYLAWIWGGLLILISFAAFADGTIRGIIGGVVALALGILFLPIVRQKSGVENLPGMGEEETGRRNVLLGIAYGFGSMVAVGTALPETETDTPSGASTNGGGDTADSGGGGSSPEFAVRIDYGGSWQGSISVTGGGSSQTESISSSGTETMEISGDVDIIAANAQKQDNSSAELTVQILNNGDVVAEASTTSAYGVAGTSQTF